MGKNECSLSRLPRGVGDTTFFFFGPRLLQYRSTVEVLYFEHHPPRQPLLSSKYHMPW